MGRYLFSLLLTFSILASASAGSNQKQNTTTPLENIEHLWADLADADAAKAYRAIWSLVKTSNGTVSFIAKHLQPAVAPDPAKVERWIDDLGSDTFAVRERANLELTKLAGLAEPNLSKALKANPSLEKGRRLQSLLNRLAGPITLGEQLRAVRAVETLERIGSDAAKALLAKYAKGRRGRSAYPRVEGDAGPLAKRRTGDV